MFVSRCSQLELHGCTLREVCVKIERIGQPEDRPFSCRLGELMVRQWEQVLLDVLLCACC